MKVIIQLINLTLLLLLFNPASHAATTAEDSLQRATPLPLNLDNDSTYQPFRFSVLPFVSSTGRNTVSTVDYAVNLIGGYNGNIRRMEVGTIFNADLGNVQWVQMAGIGNFVEKDVTGFQMAGCINIVSGKLYGAQVSGIGNMVRGTSTGVQYAGIFNMSQQHMTGIQCAGIINQNNDTSDGVQIAGIINNNLSSGNAVSIAGLVNHQEGNLRGAQISGLTNMANKNMDGVQIAGLANFSNGVHRGTQISGFVNIANKIEGTQIGVFNFSDSINGIPVGLFSYARNGYHKLEISANETFYINAAFHTGATGFHNIITAGIRPDSSRNPVWCIGYGFGSNFVISRHASLVLNVTSSQVSRTDITPKMNLLNKGYIGIEVKLGKKFAITTGPELNAWFINPQYKEYPSLFGDIKPNVFYHDQSKDKKFDCKMWIGWKFGLKFF
ncbi:MAG: hypothetical protein U0Y08_13730 [Bacteroidia bacterium]